MTCYRTQRRGAMLLITVLLVGATALTISVNVALRGIHELSAGYAMNKSREALAVADGCAQEALLQLTRNSSYTGATVSINDTVCAIAVTTNGTSKTIDIVAVIDRWTREIRLQLDTTGGISLTEWQEQ